MRGLIRWPRASPGPIYRYSASKLGESGILTNVQRFWWGWLVRPQAMGVVVVVCLPQNERHSTATLHGVGFPHQRWA